ncbi:hypothetical protein [Lacticaseibacillus saniviri]
MLIIVILVIVALLAVWLYWRISRRKKALRLLTRHSQNLTDKAVNQALQQQNWVQTSLNSTPVSDVWGHGVMAFAYQFDAPDADISQALLASALAQVADEEDIAPSDVRYPAFEVTDFWIRNQEVHFDVAFMTNQATIDYVTDIDRVNP